MMACEPSHNDDIDGKWQLREVVNEDGSVNRVDTVWYNFQTSLFMYQYYDAYDKEGEGDYHHSYGYKTREGDTNMELELITYGTPVDSFLLKTDWATAKRSFVIEDHSKNKLVLKSEGKQYNFHKF